MPVRELMTNQVIARILREMATFYEMEGVDFKPRAYRNAAESLETHGEEAVTIYKIEGLKGLHAIPGIGEHIALHIESLIRAGSFPEYKALKKKYPFDAAALTAIPGIGPSTAHYLFTAFHVENLEDLDRLAKKIHSGKEIDIMRKAKEAVLAYIEGKTGIGERRLLGDMLPYSAKLEEKIRAIPSVTETRVAGSIRRRQETIGDIDIVIATKERNGVIDAFLKFPEVAQVKERGETMVVTRLTNGMECDLRLVPPEEFGAALLHFTGDKNHNVELRKIASEKNLKLNEYGLWKGKTNIAAKTEEDVYRALDLPFIEPELRTASGEIEAAAKDGLPRLIPYGSLRGDLQVQSNWSDGSNSIEALAEAARTLGHEYIAITDHTKSLAIANGLNAKQFERRNREIDEINERHRKQKQHCAILKGAEVDILRDGKLDLPNLELAKLDFVGASVHSFFRLPREAQTKRIIKAMENPNVHAIFHPFGRRIGKRPPYDLDFDEIVKAAKATGTALEIDAFPDRLDLDDVHIRRAVEAGVMLLIDSDAHAIEHMKHLDLGIALARRGWATQKNIINTRPLAEFLDWLATPKQKRK